MKKLISIVTPCYNEEENVEILYAKVREVFKTLPNYNYEHIFIDNSSKDNTVNLLKGIAEKDSNVKIIVNIRNFGFARSPYYGLLQSHGDATILMVSDLQDPPHLIVDFIKKWEEGYKLVVGTKNKSKENPLMFFVRKVFYNLIKKISEVEQVKNFTGFGLYDKTFIDILKRLDEPYPYFRGIVTELGFERTEIPYTQPKRERGKTNFNFYRLYDFAMLGFVNYSKVPLRLSSFIGFSIAALSVFIALITFVYKLFFWDSFQMGVASVSIGIFFLGGIQLFFLGMIGEYIGAIFTQVKKRPLVIEKERVNFDT